MSDNSVISTSERLADALRVFDSYWVFILRLRDKKADEAQLEKWNENWELGEFFIQQSGELHEMHFRVLLSRAKSLVSSSNNAFKENLEEYTKGKTGLFDLVETGIDRQHHLLCIELWELLNALNVFLEACGMGTVKWPTWLPEMMPGWSWVKEHGSEGTKASQKRISAKMLALFIQDIGLYRYISDLHEGERFGASLARLMAAISGHTTNNLEDAIRSLDKMKKEDARYKAYQAFLSEHNLHGFMKGTKD